MREGGVFFQYSSFTLSFLLNWRYCVYHILFFHWINIIKKYFFRKNIFFREINLDFYRISKEKTKSFYLTVEYCSIFIGSAEDIWFIFLLQHHYLLVKRLYNHREKFCGNYFIFLPQSWPACINSLDSEKERNNEKKKVSFEKQLLGK